MSRSRDIANLLGSSSPIIDKSIIDAKGDLLIGSADNTVTKLAAGSTGQLPLADSSTSSGLRYVDYQTQKNWAVNGNFSIWQRGTSFNFGSLIYTADRWQANRGAGNTCTVTRQNVSDSINLPNIQYCARIQRNSGNTALDSILLGQSLETLNSIPLAGKIVTLSFWARVGSNYSATSNQFTASLSTGTGIDQNVLNGTYTSPATPISTTFNLTTTWQRYSTSGTLSSTTNEIGIYFNWTPTGTAGTNDYVEITGVQLEISPTVSPFEFEPYETTLRKCQRYYYRVEPGAGDRLLAPVGFVTSSTAFGFSVPFPVTMRTRPTALEQTGTAANYVAVTASGSGASFNSVPSYNAVTTQNVGWSSGTVASGLIAGNATIVMTGSGAPGAYLAWSAEL